MSLLRWPTDKRDKFLTGGGCLLVCFSLAYQAPIFSQNICYNSNCTLQFDVQFKSMPNVSVYSTANPVYIAFFRIFNLSKHLRNYCYLDAGQCHDLLVWTPPNKKNTKTLGVTCSWWFRNPAENPILPTWRNQWTSEPSTVPNSIIYEIYVYIYILIINLHEWLMFMGILCFCSFASSPALWKGQKPRCAFDNWPPSWATWDWLHRRCWDQLVRCLGCIITHRIHGNGRITYIYSRLLW